MSDARPPGSSGRRVAPRSARSRLGVRPAALSAVVGLPVLAAIVVLLTHLAGPAEPASSPPRQVALDRASFACAGGGLTVSAGQVKAGRSARADALPGGARVKGLERTDRWRTAKPDAQTVVLDQRGRGSGPVGFSAGIAPRRDGNGLAVGSCAEAASDAWLLGVGSGGRHQTSLILTNLADTPAVADLRLWGPSGPVDAVKADGLVVKPHSVRRVDLADLAAGEPRLSVHVVRQRGALAVQALDGSTGAQGGTELVRSTLSPRRDQVVGPLPRGGSGRTLTVLNPGSSTARVQIRALGEKGTFTPEGLSAVRVRAGRAVDVDLPDSVGSDRVALRVRSDVAVAASVRVAPGGSDFGTAIASAPLSGPSVVPITLDKNRRPDVVLTGTGKARASATVTAYDASMKRLDSSRVTIPAGTTVDAGVGKLDAGRAAYLVVRTQGEVVGSAVYTDGSRIAISSLRPAPVTAAGPRVRPAF